MTEKLLIKSQGIKIVKLLIEASSTKTMECMMKEKVKVFCLRKEK